MEDFYKDIKKYIDNDMFCEEIIEENQRFYNNMNYSNSYINKNSEDKSLINKNELYYGFNITDYIKFYNK